MKADTAKIEALAQQVAHEESLELFDVEIGTAGPRTLLRIFLEREGGIALREIESFSRKMSAALDVEDPFPGAYVLEVSSPGLNRRLSRPSHFAAAWGKRIKVSLAEPVAGCRNFTGVVARSDDEGIDLERDGETVRLPYRIMKKANLEVSQDELFAKGKKKR